MSHQVIWTKIVLEEFISQGNLSKLEEEIMRTRAAGWTRTKQCDTFGLSESTLDRMIKILKIKYDEAQKHSMILPPRKFSMQELYMDTH